MSRHGQTLRCQFMGRIDFYHTLAMSKSQWKRGEGKDWGGGNAEERDSGSNLAGNLISPKDWHFEFGIESIKLVGIG